MRARLEENGWLPDAISAFGQPATWDLSAVAAWGKARKEQIEAAAARAAETTDETIIADDMP